MTDLDLSPSPTAPTPDGGPSALRELAALLPGRVLLPGSPGWDRARLGWALGVDQHPAAVVTVQDCEDVVTAVRWSAQHGFSVSAQPVGHGATTALSGTVLLRTAALQ
jgi:FAD/FMN-containing dehydrogenase